MSGLAAGLVADAVDEVDDFVDAGVIVVGMRDVDGFVGEIDVDLFDAADAAAHSFDGERRWWNSADISVYIQSLARPGTSAQAGEEILTEDQKRLEVLMLGFRTSSGVAVDFLEGLPGGSATIESLLGEGLLRLAGNRARPTLLGFLMADGLPLRFV